MKDIMEITKYNQLNQGVISNAINAVRSRFNDIIEYRKAQVIETGVSYAAEKIVKSDFAKENLNTIPIMVTAIVLRFIMGVLIFNKFQYGNPLVDMIISVIITVGCQMISPTFYAIAETQAPIYMRATNEFLNNVLDSDGGTKLNYNYLIKWKNKIMLFIAFLSIIFLMMVEINSRYLIECIISSVISGIVCNYIEYLNKPPPTNRKYEPVAIKRDGIEQPQIIENYVVQNIQQYVSQHNTNGTNISINITNSDVLISEPMIRKICSFEILDESYIQPKSKPKKFEYC